MNAPLTILPSRRFREALIERGGATLGRCFQCATCSSVCDLSTEGTVFPRQQMLWAQWGLGERLLADPAIWLCHECTSCTTRCPRDARPSEVLKAARGLAIEAFGAPGILSRLVGNASVTWPLLLGLPIALWAALVHLTVGFTVREYPLAYNQHIPNLLIDAVFVPAFVFAIAMSVVGARRAWATWGLAAPRRGTLLTGLRAVAWDVLAHRGFSGCGVASARRWPHALLLWGFGAAFVTTASVATAEYVFGASLPLPQVHPIKLLGNLSAVLLTLGLWGLWRARRGVDALHRAVSAFDRFFFALVVLLVGSGLGAELARYALPAHVALSIYVVHLGMVLALFLAFPYSKFAHALYRTLAMAHDHLTRTGRTQ